MNTLAVCLHALDMRDFHSGFRHTPTLDRLRREAVFLPGARAQGHNETDSLNAEMTGLWSSRFCDSELTAEGLRPMGRGWLPPTLLERLAATGREILACIDMGPDPFVGTWAVQGGMRRIWLKDQPHRLAQFRAPEPMRFETWLGRVAEAPHFHAHVVLRSTHRPWMQSRELFALDGPRGVLRHRVRSLLGKSLTWPHDAEVARRLALRRPEAFAALRRRGLAHSDRQLGRILEAVAHRQDVAVVIYSNHGEVFDHFRLNQAHPIRTVAGRRFVVGTSHGPYPFEVVYRAMQLWLVPGVAPRVVRGTALAVDIPATLLEIAGVDGAGLDGKSLLHGFASGALLPRERVAESHGCLSLVRPDGVKVIALQANPAGGGAQPGFPAYTRAVFDLHADPDEFCNLIDSDLGRDAWNWAIRRHAEISATAPRPGGSAPSAG